MARAGKGGPEAGKEGTVVTVLDRTEASLPKGGALPPTKRSEEIWQLSRRQNQQDLAADGAGGKEGGRAWFLVSGTAVRGRGAVFVLCREHGGAELAAGYPGLEVRSQA